MTGWLRDVELHGLEPDEDGATAVQSRSGDPVAMASYMGWGTVSDGAVTEFAARYADQNEEDHQQLVAAIESGRVEAAIED